MLPPDDASDVQRVQLQKYMSSNRQIVRRSPAPGTLAINNTTVNKKSETLPP